MRARETLFHLSSRQGRQNLTAAQEGGEHIIYDDMVL